MIKFCKWSIWRANLYGLDKESIALCHQIRTIDKKRLTKEYGQITSKALRKEIMDALCFQLGIVKQ